MWADSYYIISYPNRYRLSLSTLPLPPPVPPPPGELCPFVARGFMARVRHDSDARSVDVRSAQLTLGVAGGTI